MENQTLDVGRMEKELVSIIILSRNNGKFVEESVKSVLAQTYQNWELLFVDGLSEDDTIEKLLALRKEDSRFRISYTVFENGAAMHFNSALRGVQGRWVPFMLCGDVWEPTKLQKQVSFMEENVFSFSYTKFQMMNEKGQNQGVVVGGKKTITYNDLIKSS